jgi:GH25 family lysozyme M1 (1,4-beta-N-acetylmuramidase)
LSNRSRRFGRAALWAIGLAFAAQLAPVAMASDFSEPWKNPDRALVVDAYEYNPIDWRKLAEDKRVVGFINKASDGLPPAYSCSGNETEVKLCGALWKRHAVARELYHTRKTVAKALGLRWGAYHLARPGNPIDQANNFIDFAEPEPDDLLAIDIEENDPEKWMSLEDAEEFVRHVHRRIGRFPILYTNGTTAQHIADNREKYPLLSRLPLWYARYKPEIGIHFPKGNWQSYALWQFAAQANCNERSCPYRVPGTPNDIDVNVAPMSAAELRKAWPFGGLLDVPIEMIAKVPVPVTREAGLAGEVTLAYASVQAASPIVALENMFQVRGQPYPERYGYAATEDKAASLLQRFGGYLASLRQTVVAWAFGDPDAPAGLDPIATATIPARAEIP